MTEEPEERTQPAKQTPREERLKAALRQNLARRKAQSRVRAGRTPDVKDKD